MLVYMYQAALLCEACGEAKREELDAQGKAPEDVDDESSYDSGDYPKGPMEESESDSPSHCDACGEFLESPLTDEGVNATRVMIEEAIIKGTPIKDSVALREWMPFYSIDPEDPHAVRLARMTKRLRETADKETGELPAYAWPGGYPIFYVTKSCDVVCVKCANDAETGSDAFGGEPLSDSDVNWEDPDLWCDCGERIESAYAEDDAEENAAT